MLWTDKILHTKVIFFHLVAIAISLEVLLLYYLNNLSNGIYSEFLHFYSQFDISVTTLSSHMFVSLT